MNGIVDLLLGNPGISREGGGFVQGIVTDNSDKDHAGMVKVEFTGWKQGGNIHEWMPVLRPYGGKSYGAYAMPENGDIVLVGFAGGSFRGPFVLGVLSPGGAFDKEAFEKKNNVKKVKTRGGVEFSVSDEDGKQSAQLKTPGGLTVSLSDEKQAVEIRTKDGKNTLTLNAKGGEIAVKSETKLTLECGSAKLILEKNGKLTLKCGQLAVEAKQTGSLKGGQQFTIEGGILKVEGKQTLGLKGGTITQLEGAIVKIN